MEAVDAGIDFIVCITEGIPIEDEIKAVNVVKYSKSRLLGPNCPGILTVGGAKIGIIPASMFMPGPIGIVSRSGTLTYESVDALTRRASARPPASASAATPCPVRALLMSCRCLRPILRPKPSSCAAKSAARTKRLPPSTSRP